MDGYSDLEESLNILAQECENSKEFRQCIEDLLRIHRNIHSNPDVDKYYHLKLSSKLMQNLWKFEGARLFLSRVGWKEENYVLNMQGNGIEQLKVALQALQDYRLIAPEASEWTNKNKVENLTRAQVREEGLRAEAAKVRQKELEDFYADQKERQELALNIKKHIREDVENRKHKQWVAPVKSKTQESLTFKEAGEAASKRL